MCGTSKYFSYSDVARGQPGQNCTIAIEKFMDEVARKAAGTYWTFSSVLFLFFCLHHLVRIQKGTPPPNRISLTLERRKVIIILY